MKSNIALKILTSVFSLGFCLAASALTAGSEQNEFPLKDLEAGKLYGITVSIDSPYRLGGSGEIEASISDPGGLVASKILHAGDLDFYVTLRARASGNGHVKLNRRSGAKAVGVSVACRPLKLAGNSNAVIAALPNSTWQEAQEFELGQTIFGANDERAFIPAPSEDTYRALVRGFQWFKFTFKKPGPKLVYFTLDVLDRWDCGDRLGAEERHRDPRRGDHDGLRPRDRAGLRVLLRQERLGRKRAVHDHHQQGTDRAGDGEGGLLRDQRVAATAARRS